MFVTLHRDRQSAPLKLVIAGAAYLDGLACLQLRSLPMLYCGYPYPSTGGGRMKNLLGFLYVLVIGMAATACSLIPDLPGPIGIPGI
jgi:hypothetical protein